MSSMTMARRGVPRDAALARAFAFAAGAARAGRFRGAGRQRQALADQDDVGEAAVEAHLVEVDDLLAHPLHLA